MNELLNLFNYQNNLNITGLTDELNSFYIAEKHKKDKKNTLVVTSTLFEANKYYETIKNIYSDTYIFPMDDFVNTVALASSPELKVKRLETLEVIKTNKNVIIITNIMGYLKLLPSKNKENKLYLKVGSEINKKELINKINSFGYHKESIVTTTGEYAERGFIIDLFLPFNEKPVRLEFFGNTIESIRFFNVDTQISSDKIDEIIINNFNEDSNDNDNLYNYLNKPYVYYINYDQIKDSYINLEEQVIEYKEKEKVDINKKYIFNFDEIPVLEYTNLSTLLDSRLKALKSIKYSSKTINNFNGNFKLLKQYVNDKIKLKKTVVITVSKESQINFIKNIFDNKIVLSTIDSLKDKTINIVKYNLSKGFEFDKFVFITQNDIESYQTYKSNYKNMYKIGRKIKDYAELNIGDYVVHYAHGIGIYNGIKTLKKQEIIKDYLQIIYKNNDKIYVPVEKIDSIFKYSDKDGTVPKINSLNSVNWQKTKNNLSRKIKDISEELIKIYALRKETKCPKYKDYIEEKMFANDFVYEETPDQQKAIEEVLNDLRSENPMDRLLCGDVGFGKTEVAFRGIFKTILNGYQVAYLCPTTILSSQQFKLAIERFSKYGVNIALLNRFISQKKQKETIEKIKNGTIDLVIGTHRLLSDDIEFKKLGLLVIDEEQRFGVTHKEKIKKLKSNVNVLTMTATPIPRTLKMAISGLRDLSIIDTAPMNRYPIQTYVIKENDLLVKDAIYKELSRKGQIFILYNNIKNIEKKVQEIQKLVPDAKIVYAHGQMSKIELENIMQQFINHEFDILICTTIIETGIDIPNTNTLIIYDADHFGLSQLYQIRGRVGRSDRIAYAYLLLNKTREINSVATKRLQAIKEFTELGSGYKIAMRDITIRGAGDILGSQQAGFVDSVGLELYMHLINNEVKKILGEEVEDIDLTDKTILNVNTHIEDDYVDDEKLKIEIHKRINEINSHESLLLIKEEIEDRFGKINEDLLIYMYEEWFEKIIKKLNISRVIQTNESIEIELPEDISNTIEGDKLLIIVNNLTKNFVISYKFKKIYIKLYLKNLEKHFIYYLIELFTKLFPGK